MAQTPAERRARRDLTAQSRINPDTGVPFRNYNALDTWQRNQRAQAQGFRNRYELAKRRALGPGPELRRAYDLPNSFENFLQGREPTEALAQDFNRAFGHGSSGSSTSSRQRNKALRLRFASEEGWDWRVWRDEYAA
jgi:hypothetical protein